MIYYIVRYRDVALAVRIKYVDCVNRWGQESNLNFVQFYGQYLHFML